MPAVCRFYLKGYCRYGSSCRFEHPGEDSGGGGASNFSFAKAIAETTSNNTTNFSFAKALEETNYSRFDQQPNAFFNSTPYFNPGQQPNQFGGPFDQVNSFYGGNTQTGFNSSPYQQQYNNYNQANNTVGSFSFARAATEIETSNHFNNSFNNSGFPTFQPAASAQTNPCFGDIDMRGGAGNQTQQNIDLTEPELQAYQAPKFQFRLIPVRPPPSNLCF